MSTSDPSADSVPYDYPTEFAGFLLMFRDRMRFSVRELGERAGCSHSQIVRAENGPKVPTWNVASSILGACGCGKGALLGWRTVWQVAKDAERELLHGYEPLPGREWFWVAARREWDIGLKMASTPNPILARLRDLRDRDALGIAIRALADRSDLHSVRDISEAAGMPKSTVHRWLNASRSPTASQLLSLVAALGATPEECDAFLDALRQLGETPCAEPHPDSRLPCVRDHRHRGWHLTGGGTRWLDEGPSFEMVMSDYRPNARYLKVNNAKVAHRTASS